MVRQFSERNRVRSGAVVFTNGIISGIPFILLLLVDFVKKSANMEPAQIPKSMSPSTVAKVREKHPLVWAAPGGRIAPISVLSFAGGNIFLSSNRKKFVTGVP